MRDEIRSLQARVNTLEQRVIEPAKRLGLTQETVDRMTSKDDGFTANGKTKCPPPKS